MVWIATNFLLVGLLLWLAGRLSYMRVLTSTLIPNEGNKLFDATSLVIRLQIWRDFVMTIVVLNSPQCEERGKSSFSQPDLPPVRPTEVFDPWAESCKLFFLLIPYS